MGKYSTEIADYDDFNKALHQNGPLAEPYELLLESDEHSGHAVRFMMVAKLPSGRRAVAEATLALNLTMLNLSNAIRETIMELKNEIRVTLAMTFPQGERDMRLWIAKSLNFDRIFFTAQIPPQYVEKYNQSQEASRKKRVEDRREYLEKKAKEQRQRQADRMMGTYSGKTKQSLAGIVRKPVAAGKTSSKTPRCPVHDEPMKYDAQADLWRCDQPRKDHPERGCNLTAQPKQSRRENELTMGQGRVILQIVVNPEIKNASPRYILLAANNVAIDITDLPLFATGQTYLLKSYIRSMLNEKVTTKTFRLDPLAHTFNYEDGTIKVETSFAAEAVQIVFRSSP